jgi:integrase
MRKRTGTVYKRKKEGTWWAKVTFVDPVAGKLRQIQRRAANKAAAFKERDRLLRMLDEGQGRTIDPERMTFAQLAEHYSVTHLVPAQYVDGRKIAGLRSLRTPKAQMEVLRTHFGRRLIRSITAGDVRSFKRERLETPTRHGGQRTISSVNRELALLRQVLNTAQAEGWLHVNPFAKTRLISVADERKRERILARSEEALLLAACDHPQRLHLRPIVICALDTGMRQAEILKLCWQDLDLLSREITIQATNTKTLTMRRVAMTTRLHAELQRLQTAAPARPGDLVFGVRNNVKRAFASVRCAAGVTDLRFHDLRHTAATRLIASGMALAEVARVLGHTQISTTYRYVNADQGTIQRAAAALDSFHAASEEQQPEQNASAVVN